MEFKPGSKCFAKVKGYSPWPARIDVLPFDVKIPRGKYPIFFYGTHEVSFVLPKDIYDFDKYRSIFGLYKEKNAKFNDGIDEINDNPTIFQLGFDDRAVEFLAQFYKFDARKIHDEAYRKLVRIVRSDDKHKQSSTALDRKRPHNINDSPDNHEPVIKILKKEVTEKNNNHEQVHKTLKKEVTEKNSHQEQIHKILKKEVTEKNSNKEQVHKILRKEDTEKKSHPEQIHKILRKEDTEKNSNQEQAHKILKKEDTEKNSNQEQVLKILKKEVTETNSNQEAVLKTLRKEDTEKNNNEEPVLKIFKKEDTEKNNLSPHVVNMSVVSEILIKLTPLRDDFTLTSKQEELEDNCIVKKKEINNKALENNDSTDASDKSSVSKTKKDIALNSFKSPTEATDPDRPIRTSAMKFKQNFKKYLQNLSQNQKCPDKKPESSVKIRKDCLSSKYRNPERKSSISEDNIHPKSEKLTNPVPNLTIDQNKTPSGLTNCTNPVYSKDENNLRIVSKLSIIDKEIKRSLIVGQENHEKCRKLMGNLLDLNNLSLVLLCRVPEIIVTIRKCRRYKKDDMIKSSASQIFQHFCQLYEDADLEEKIEAGAELLKRDSSDCKSAQTLFNELFVIEKPNQFSKHKLTSLTLSSPSSAHSIHSSADNTPSLNADTFNDVSELGFTLDPDVININDLIDSGMLVLIESYSFEESVSNCKRKPSSVTKEKRLINDDMELYKQLGV